MVKQSNGTYVILDTSGKNKLQKVVSSQGRFITSAMS